MAICKICNEREADKKGSHLLPFFLIKPVDNLEGHKGRGKELGFIMDGLETKSYFGQSIQPEKLKEVYGEIKEEEFSLHRPDNIVDYFFCTECEKKMGEIEDVYAKLIRGEKTKLTTDQTKRVSFLFWVSIMFRISISEFSNPTLKPKEENRLRRLLTKGMYLPWEEVLTDSDINGIGYKLIRCKEYSKNNESILMGNYYHKRPYSIIIDEFVLFFYFKQSYLESNAQLFYGFELELQNAEMNVAGHKEIVWLITEDKMNDGMKLLQKDFSRNRNKKLSKMFNHVHRSMGGKGKMPKSIQMEILSEIFNEEKPLAKQGTWDDILTSIYKVVSKYVKQ